MTDLYNYIYDVKSVHDIITYIVYDSKLIKRLNKLSAKDFVRLLEDAGAVIFETGGDLQNYFYDYFQEIYNVPDEVMFYVDIEFFIIELIRSRDIDIYYIQNEGIFILFNASIDIEDEIQNIIEQYERV